MKAVFGIGATVVVIAIIVLLVIRNTEPPTDPQAGRAVGDIARSDLTAPPEAPPPDAAARGTEFWGSNYRGSSYAGANYRATSYMNGNRNRSPGGPGFGFGFAEERPVKIQSGSAAGYYGSAAPYGTGAAGSSRGYEAERAAARAGMNQGIGGGSGSFGSRSRSYGSASYGNTSIGSGGVGRPVPYGTSGFIRPTYYGSAASSYVGYRGSAARTPSAAADHRLGDLEPRAEVVEQRVNSLLEKIESAKK